MRILFCYPNLHMRVTIPGGISILSACLKRAGYNDIELFDGTWFTQDDGTADRNAERVKRGQVKPYQYNWSTNDGELYSQWRKKVLEYNPDVIISSIVEDTFVIWKKMMDEVSDCKFISIVGGVFPTSAPHIFDGLCDYICRGEGDEAIPEMISAIEKGESCSDILNVYPNPLRYALDVNTLPIGDLTIFPEKSLYRPFKGKIVKIGLLETQRGCPFTCAFCNSPEKTIIYKKENAGKFHRHRSIKHIEKEVKHLVEQHKVEFMWIITDTLLTMSPKDFDDFCAMWKEYGSLPFWCQTRPELLTDYQAKKLVEIGCASISIGVEHGNAEYRAKVIGRKYDNQLALDAFDRAYYNGLNTDCNFIVGYPYETLEYAWDTVNFARQLKCKDINCAIFTPYHGTKLRKVCEDEGFIDKNVICQLNTEGNSMLDMPPPYMNKEEIKFMYDNFVEHIQ